MNKPEIIADLKRMRDDVNTLNDIIYGARREAQNGENLEFPLKSVAYRLNIINDIWKRIQENYGREL